jgi:hypothetical protein
MYTKVGWTNGIQLMTLHTTGHLAGCTQHLVVVATIKGLPGDYGYQSSQL